VLIPWLSHLFGAGRRLKALLAAFAALVFLVSFLSYFEGHFYTLSTRIEDLPTTTSDRMSFLKLSLESIQSSLSSSLIGVGTGGFRRLAGYGEEQLGSIDVYAHNIFAEHLCENGLLGLCALLTLFFIVARKALRLLRDHEEGNPWVIWVHALLLFSFVNALFSGDANGNRLLFTCFGMIYAADNICRQ
jgi:O-antigen ligase